MATALRKIDQSAVAAGNDLAPVTTAALEPAPQRYVVRELTMALNAGFQFLYRDPGPAEQLPPGGIDAVVAGPAGAVGAAEFTAAVEGVDAETPLDLRVYGAPIQIVLRLDPAISLRDVGVAAHYGHLRHVRPDGTPQPDPLDDCKLVYLAANSPDVGPAGQYSHGFNFHVELTGTGANGHSQVLPIIIDRDVGIPGGSNT